ncbi:MAG: tRNA threonylcarbamoyladenosine dehydratase [Bdellovibrionota bacterium]|jgi:tRNA A37 threonylcarbamoyladenosine dehydratase
MDERFARISMLLGEAAMQRLQMATVTVVGLGAVGGQALEALSRSGVGRIRVVDFDIIRRTNINRQILALESTIGQAKSDLAASRIAQINPTCTIEVLKLFVAEETLDEVLSNTPGIVIDAIDSLNPKSKLIDALLTREIPFISSMGAARLKDPFSIKVGHFSEVTKCPLAHMVKRRLKSIGQTRDFLCVYSDEEPIRTAESILPPDDDFYKRGRDRRPLGSSPIITAIFGLLAANTVIDMIIKE